MIKITQYEATAYQVRIKACDDTKLRKKTGDPNKIAGYLAEHINALVLAYEPKLMA